MNTTHKGMTYLLTSSTGVHVKAAIDTMAAKQWLKSWLDPITTLLLWLIPTVAIISMLIAFVGWYGKDEREKQQQPFFKIAKTHIIVLVIAESLTTILKILGL
ncbi:MULTISPECIES: hypothetical protein [Terrabacteria group]|uniref:hypothetical protein n=1 Tax=Bacillati TaxID=1783272 RepID=UPI001939FBF1|nr:MULTISPECIES: hypothetical protein [Terrabacteria group]MBW9213110.1 hypothetical protein [Trueperella sp. zg.1013]QRG86933.1 hypothetical protein JOS54_01040 [Bulleidia sp. zg-1006]